MRVYSAIAALMLLSGCAINSGVQPFANDVFYVSRQGATGASSQSDLRGAAMNEARAFCEQREQPFQLVELIEAHPPFILGNFPKAEVRFRCAPAAN